MIKLWFDNLAETEKNLVIYGVIALVICLFLWLHFAVADKLAMQEQRLLGAINNKAWVSEAVTKIKRQGSLASGRLSQKSLVQISELVSNRVGIRASRFQPSGTNEGQVWFEEIPFTKVIEYSSRLEQDFSIQINNVAITAAKKTGLVNLRMRLAK